LKEVRGDNKDSLNNNDIDPSDKKFEFSDFTTFSKIENQNLNNIYNNDNNQLVSSSSPINNNNNLAKKKSLETDIMFKEINSQYKSTRSYNTLNNYCSIHQINGNFQTQDHELNLFSNLFL